MSFSSSSTSSSQASAAGMGVNSLLAKPSQLDKVNNAPLFKACVDKLDYKWYSWTLLALSIIGIPLAFIARELRAVKIDLGGKKIYLNIKNLKNRMNIAKSEVQHKTSAILLNLFESRVTEIFNEELLESVDLPTSVREGFRKNAHEFENGWLIRDPESQDPQNPNFFVAQNNLKGQLKILKISSEVFKSGKNSVLRIASDLGDYVEKIFKTPRAQGEYDQDQLRGEYAMRAQFQTAQPGLQESGVQDSEEMTLNFPQEHLYGMIEPKYDDNLASLLRPENTLTPLQRLEIAEKTLKAIQIMWQKGIPHGNISPLNICYIEKTVAEKPVFAIRLIGLTSQAQRDRGLMDYNVDYFGEADSNNLRTARASDLGNKASNIQAVLMQIDLVATGLTLVKLITGTDSSDIFDGENYNLNHLSAEASAKIPDVLLPFLRSMTDPLPENRMKHAQIGEVINAISTLRNQIEHAA